MRVPLPVLAAAALAACAAPAPDAHIPPYARVPYAALSRASIVAIALREWRAFGMTVNDDAPGTAPPMAAEAKPERQPGLWQRVGDYWWLGLDRTRPEAGWTGRHDETGREFPASADGGFPWSAAFISYVLRAAGAGARFPYAPAHWEYIDAAKRAFDNGDHTALFVAAAPEAAAPQPGDLICTGRGRAEGLRFAHLPAGPYPAHCDIVVGVEPGRIAVIGGNVGDGVTLKHVPVTAEGRLATPDGTVLDARYPWMAVLRLNAGLPGA